MRTRTIHDLPIDTVHPTPQVRERFDDESLRSLAMTMKTVGVQQPISVRRADGGYAIIAGERRWRAAKRAELTTIPAVVVEGDLSEADIIELQLIENCAREDLNPVEKAKAYDRLMKAAQRSAAEAARRTGSSPAMVSKLTSLLLLPPDILAHVHDGRIPYSSAYELVKVSDPAEQRRLADEIAGGRMTRQKLVEQTRARAKAPGSRRQGRRATTPRERVVIALGEGRSVSVAAPTLSVECVVALLVDVTTRVRNAAEGGGALADVVRAVSGNGR
ncbi:MAG: ParB/RepB/Spo0J family partition protein [Cyanobacteria bacterium CYA]|nr:MAG: ParB/RepB/Spo0J family partition protein [Cyanobacteria bacterium CYA]